MDFATVRDRLLVPWAGSDLLRRRQLAAWALSTAVDQGAEASVRGLLRDWADGSVAKRWTTTRTVSVLADLLGRSAIGLIHTIARQPAQDERLARELVQTVADLLTGPVALQTLGTLTNWATAGNPCRPLAFRAFLRAADRRESSRAASRPILLRLAASNRAAWAYHSELWRTMLNDTKDNKDARQCLARWVVLAGGDQDLETQLGRLFSGLARSPNESARLDHLLRYLPATAPATALPVAERLRERLPVPSIADL
ncbi:hypothetical protein F1D05_02650 [Kribbella qitaiheensis]|uniref:HEAT repeat domain-containing protein n=1 Tax=Kribbella qitaiheensis TaxID=1544730 RepID=A0A7G6WSP5_9ACTN|nr:hypothetical protein [Kribbella qitaiheensis]QNE17010.1 hypothetical protein F1D05_02650 [Kribbella qitaiheensis]